MSNSKAEADRLKRKEVSEQIDQMSSKQLKDFADWFNDEIVEVEKPIEDK